MCRIIFDIGLYPLQYYKVPFTRGHAENRSITVTSGGGEPHGKLRVTARLGNLCKYFGLGASSASSSELAFHRFSSVWDPEKLSSSFSSCCFSKATISRCRLDFSWFRMLQGQRDWVTATGLRQMCPVWLGCDPVNVPLSDEPGRAQWPWRESTVFLDLRALGTCTRPLSRTQNPPPSVPSYVLPFSPQILYLFSNS